LNSLLKKAKLDLNVFYIIYIFNVNISGMAELKIAIGADHAGFKLKEDIKSYLISKGYKVLDFGTNSSEPTDYPEFGHKVAKSVKSGESDRGFTMCGSGNGMNMTANKYPGIRSALCWKKEIAVLARQHNDANICALPSRFISKEEAIEIANAFLDTKFEGGRHERRINKISIDL
jgi:ribose 5-phosphate isomerase B